MTKLETLIAELCPEGVEWKALGEVAEVTKLAGFEFTEHITYAESGNIIALRALNVKNEKLNLDNVKYIDSSNFSKLTRSKLYINDMLFTYVGTIGEVALIDFDDRYYLAPNVARIRFNHLCSAKFMLYLFKSKNFVDKQINKYLMASSMKNLTMENIRKFKIPIPPLTVQEEIVNILDKFTELTAELQELLAAELSARKKQYEYYREKLLTFGDDVGWKALGEIGRVAMCKRIMKAETTSTGEVPFYKIGTFGKQADAYITEEKFLEYKKKYSFPQKGDILISAAGTIGRTVTYDGNPAYYQDSNIVWLEHNESIILNTFLRYYYQLSPWNASVGGTISRLYNDDIRKIKIPIPPLAEQERIVAILDRFDALCNDLTSGLPAEIAARQKQYEYYRDKLLSFKEKG